MRKNLHQR